MRLITAHRILIVTAILFFLLYAVVKTQRYVAGGAAFDGVQAVLALAVAVGLHLYFRSLARWGKR